MLLFTAAPALAGDLSYAFAFPNPFAIGAGQTTLTFNNLAATCTIRIYSASGDPITIIQETDGDGQATWNGTNTAGENTMSGLYLYLIESATDKKFGKFIIVR